MTSDEAVQLPVSCPQCEKEMRSALVKSAIWHKERLVVVEDIPAYVCDSCVEQYYDPAATDLLRSWMAEDFASVEAVRELLVPVYSVAGLVEGRRTVSYMDQEVY
jgi:YgiT-type zinc finger domain-containing protein